MWILKQKDADAYYEGINGTVYAMTTDPDKAMKFDFQAEAVAMNIKHELEAEIIQIAGEENGTQ